MQAETCIIKIRDSYESKHMKNNHIMIKYVIKDT